MDISPDHSQLLVASATGTENASEFWALPLPSGPPRRIGNIMGYSGKWSLNGRKLMFAKDREVYFANADGSGERKLFEVVGFSDPSFSPDGTRIRFTSAPANNSNSIWEVRADGTGLYALLPVWRNPPSECCGVWSPDGRYFFFLSNMAVGGNIWRYVNRGDCLTSVAVNRCSSPRDPCCLEPWLRAPMVRSCSLTGFRHAASLCATTLNPANSLSISRESLPAM
jgi:Tol biopolymer transport system component